MRRDVFALGDVILRGTTAAGVVFEAAGVPAVCPHRKKRGCDGKEGSRKIVAGGFESTPRKERLTSRTISLFLSLPRRFSAFVTDGSPRASALPGPSPTRPLLRLEHPLRERLLGGRRKREKERKGEENMLKGSCVTHFEAFRLCPEVAVVTGDRRFGDTSRGEQLLVDVILPAHVALLCLAPAFFYEANVASLLFAAGLLLLHRACASSVRLDSSAARTSRVHTETEESSEPRDGDCAARA